MKRKINVAFLIETKKKGKKNEIIKDYIFLVKY